MVGVAPRGGARGGVCRRGGWRVTRRVPAGGAAGRRGGRSAGGAGRGVGAGGREGGVLSVVRRRVGGVYTYAHLLDLLKKRKHAVGNRFDLAAAVGFVHG